MFQAVNIIDYDQEAVFIVVDYFNGRLKCLLDVMKLLIQMQGLNQRKGEVVINAVDPENMSDAGIGSRSVKNFLQDRFGNLCFTNTADTVQIAGLSVYQSIGNRSS